MNGVVLVEFGDLVDLAHHDDEGGCAAEKAIIGSKVILPRSNEMRDALLEELAVDLDLRHRCDKIIGAARRC